MLDTTDKFNKEIQKNEIYIIYFLYVIYNQKMINLASVAETRDFIIKNANQN
jgi:hypothetical protein